jgi:hypothetical protein
MWSPRAVSISPPISRLFSFAAVLLLMLFGPCPTARAQASLATPQLAAPVAQVPTAIPSPPSLREEARTARAPGSKATAIRPEFLPGNTYRFVTRTELRTSLGGSGTAFVEQQARFDTGVRVDGKNGVVIKARSERLDVQLQSGGRTITYESLKPEDRATLVGRHFEAALYRSVDFTLNEDLRVASAVEGGRIGPETPLPGLPQFGPDELKQLMGTIPQGFPAKPVHPGDTWTLQGSRSVGSAGALNFEITYRFTGPVTFEENQCLNIEFAGQLSGDVPLPAPAEGEAAATGGFIGLQGHSLTGRLLFDPLDKMLRFSEQRISLALALPGPGEAPAKPVPVEQTTTIRLLHVVPTP